MRRHKTLYHQDSFRILSENLRNRSQNDTPHRHCK